MKKAAELSDPNSCMSRAKDDEMTFVLLGRDAAAPVAIRAWVNERLRLGKNGLEDKQIQSAILDAAAMDGNREWVAESVSPAPQPKCLHDHVDSHARCLDCGELATKAPEPVAAPQEVTRYWYASEQHTHCAVCGEDKHTPLRLDEPDGYVCLTCILKLLEETQTDRDGYESELEKVKAEYVSLREELDKVNREKKDYRRSYEDWKQIALNTQSRLDKEQKEYAKNVVLVEKRAEKAESQVADMRKALNRTLERMDYIEKNWSGTIDVRDIKVELEYDEAREALGK